MEIIRRRLFFWTLVLVFFIVAPVIILNARGYRFDFHRGVFVYGGAVTIKSIPQTVDISLNGESVSGKVSRINNSHNITGLLPGDYSITASLPGYRSWSKKIDVHSGVASEFWNVVLVKENYEKANYADTENISRFFISPQNGYIAYTKNTEENLKIEIFNIGDEKTEKEFSIPEWQMITEEKKENIEWSPSEDYISIPLQKEMLVDTKKSKIATKSAPNNLEKEIRYAYFIINPNDSTVVNLNEFLEKDNIRDVRWDPKDKDYLFFMEGSNLWRANITDAKNTSLISENVSAYDLSHSNIFYVQTPNNLIFKSSLDGQSSRSQVTNDFPGDPAEVIERIIVYDDSRIALLGRNKDLLIFNEGEKETYFRKLGSNVEGLHFSDDGKKMLFWSNNEISVYFVRDWKVQPTRMENELTNITRYSEKIENVQWLKDYEHVVFNTGKWIKVIELDGRDRRNCMDLINTQTEKPIIRLNNSLEYLYFTDIKDGKNFLHSIIFPEPTPILGIGG